MVREKTMTDTATLEELARRKVPCPPAGTGSEGRCTTCGGNGEVWLLRLSPDSRFGRAGEPALLVECEDKRRMPGFHEDDPCPSCEWQGKNTGYRIASHDHLERLLEAVRAMHPKLKGKVLRNFVAKPI